jgi:tetratricopeptide (TPR) repeat protein/uncharacterized protein YjeT (DUF2065 family)
MMRFLFVKTFNLLIRSRVGRWALALVLILAGLILVFNPSAAGRTDTTTVIIEGSIPLLLGLFVLGFSIFLEIKLRKAGKIGAEIKAMVASGKILPIPALPKSLPKGVSKEDAQEVAQYAARLARLPWGAKPAFASVEEAYPLFNRTVARVREVTGDWSQLSGPIDTFVSLPKPLCYIGAAEIIMPLSYLHSDIFVPIGLQQGLRFIAQAQYVDPEQPDALVTRIKLLTRYPAERWLQLAEETLAALKRIAPTHPRLPDAEGAILLKRGRLKEALECNERMIEHPSSPEEEHVALSARARIFNLMKRPEEAIAAWDVVNERYPNDPWAWHNKSILLRDMGRLEEALECNERALSIMPFEMARRVGKSIRARMAEAAGEKPPSEGLNSVHVEERDRRVI